MNFEDRRGYCQKQVSQLLKIKDSSTVGLSVNINLFSYLRIFLFSIFFAPFSESWQVQGFLPSVSWRQNRHMSSLQKQKTLPHGQGRQNGYCKAVGR